MFRLPKDWINKSFKGFLSKLLLKATFRAFKARIMSALRSFSTYERILAAPLREAEARVVLGAMVEIQNRTLSAHKNWPQEHVAGLCSRRAWKVGVRESCLGSEIADKARISLRLQRNCARGV